MRFTDLFSLAGIIGTTSPEESELEQKLSKAKEIYKAISRIPMRCIQVKKDFFQELRKSRSDLSTPPLSQNEILRLSAQMADPIVQERNTLAQELETISAEIARIITLDGATTGDKGIDGRLCAVQKALDQRLIESALAAIKKKPRSRLHAY